MGQSFNDEGVEASSGNVFADLGLPNPEELLVKSTLAITVKQLIEEKGWTERETSQCAGIDRLQLSKLMRGKLSDYSSERLFAILNQLGHSVEVRISANETAPENAHTHVTMA
jgi:predicted XRE-type DNA-binding protein